MKADCCSNADGDADLEQACKETTTETTFRYEEPQCIKVVTTFDETNAQVGDPTETNANLEECCVWASENSNADLVSATCPMLPEMSWYWDTDASCCV